MTAWTMARASAADLAGVVALLERCELPTSGVADNIQAFAVARSDAGIIGSSGVEAYASSGLLRSVAVDPSRRDCGIGAKLVEHAIARARDEGLLALYLLTTTAQAYFERHGFRVCPRDEAPAGVRDSWEFRTGCPAAAVFMRRAIG